MKLSSAADRVRLSDYVHCEGCHGLLGCWDLSHLECSGCTEMAAAEEKQDQEWLNEALKRRLRQRG